MTKEEARGTWIAKKGLIVNGSGVKAGTKVTISSFSHETIVYEVGDTGIMFAPMLRSFEECFEKIEEEEKKDE